MAYYLNFLGTTDYVQLGQFFVASIGEPYKVEIDLQGIDGSGFGLRIFGRSGSNVSRLIQFKGNNGRVIAPLADVTPSNGTNVLTRNILTLERLNSDTNVIFINGVEVGRNLNSGSLSFEWIGTELSASNGRNGFRLYRLKTWLDGVLINDWNPSLSNGTGITLIDSVDGNNGTFINPPANNSQWVFYDDGGTLNQDINSSFVAPRIRLGALTGAVVNEQAVQAIGVAARSRGALFDAVIVQGQEFEGSGALARSRSASLDSSLQNLQEVSGTASLSRTRGAVFAGASVNDIGDWGAPVELVEEALPIKQMSLGFDQLGRPIVFYRVGADELKLYWYDPILQTQTLLSLTVGIDPVISFDFPQDSNQSFTDLLMFYVRNGVVYMRVQRDRFTVEYPTGVSYPGVRIESAGLTVENSFQVIYTYPGV